MDIQNPNDNVTESTAPGNQGGNSPPGDQWVNYNPPSKIPLEAQHQKLLDDSGISPEVAEARGYRSAVSIDAVAEFAENQRLIPALLLPVWTVNGNEVFCQSRPDVPRKGKDGKALKYETPAGQSMVIDVHPSIRSELGDPSIPLHITEGIRKADSAVSRGLCCIDILGVWNWRGKNEDGGLTALADWELIALNGRIVYLVFDSDASTNANVQKALSRLKKFLEFKGANVYVLNLPGGQDGAKVGLDDYLVEGNDLEPLIDNAVADIGFEPTGVLTEPLNDQGDAIRFAARERGTLAWSPHLKTWLIWKSELRGSGIGGRWVEDAGEIAALRRVKLMVENFYKEALALNEEDKKKLRAHAMACGDIGRQKKILESAHTELAIDITEFDQDDWLLNCQNGVLDLKTFTRRSAEPTDRCRWQADVEYVAGATDSTFDKFLTENIPNMATREFYQELAGYMLTGDRRCEKMGAAYGPKRSGKSTFAEMARTCLGSYAALVQPDIFMVAGFQRDGEANRPVLASLVGKRLVTAPEGAKEHTFDVALVKQLTGGEAVNACAKYKAPFSYVPRFFILLYGNHRPKTDFEEEAFRSRLIELPFPIGHEEDKVDENLKRYLLTDPSAKRAWLAWAVEGLRRLVEKKMKLVPPPEVAASTAAYWDAQNVLGPFVSKLVFERGAFAPSQEINREFEIWKSETFTKVEKSDLIKWLQSKGCTNGTKKLPDGSKPRGWHGVRLVEDEKGTGGREGTPFSGNFCYEEPNGKVYSNPRPRLSPASPLSPAEVAEEFGA